MEHGRPSADSRCRESVILDRVSRILGRHPASSNADVEFHKTECHVVKTEEQLFSHFGKKSAEFLKRKKIIHNVNGKVFEEFYEPVAAF